ncbi:MAG: hypothetical protein LBT02_00470 [Rickettsiales bacterium]|jgi:hypothetical protein|nr:hypothetical protein [Rickettsiales bacterium]
MTDIQKTIYDILIEQNSGNFIQLSGIFSCTPANTNFPHMVVAIKEMKDISNFTERISSCILEIKIYSEANSRIFMLSIIQEIENLLNIEIFKSIKEISVNIDNDGGILCGKIIYNIIN